MKKFLPDFPEPPWAGTQWLDLEASFLAFGDERGQHPIGREFRVFAGGGSNPCLHFYWPEDAFEEFTNPSAENWRELLREASQIEDSLKEHLIETACKAARAVDQEVVWSVDFALDRSGIWWVIDMAHARDSWHPRH